MVFISPFNIVLLCGSLKCVGKLFEDFKMSAMRIFCGFLVHKAKNGLHSTFNLLKFSQKSQFTESLSHNLKFPTKIFSKFRHKSKAELKETNKDYRRIKIETFPNLPKVKTRPINRFQFPVNCRNKHRKDFHYDIS